MLGNLTGWHLLILLAVILLLFGAAKLPALARSVGQSARVFRGEMKEMKKENEADNASPDVSGVQAASPIIPQTTSDTAGGTTEHKP